MRKKFKLALTGLAVTVLLSACSNSFPEYSGDLNSLILLSRMEFDANFDQNESDPTLLYVHPSLGIDSNSGLTVGRPVRSIHKALELADSGYEIHVAQGTYSCNSQATPLKLKAGVTLLGGYKFDDWNIRDFKAYPSIIHDNYFGPNPGSMAVAVIAQNLATETELNGFTLKGGGGFSNSISISISNSSVKLRNFILNPGSSSDEITIAISAVGSQTVFLAERMVINMNDSSKAQVGLSISEGHYTILNSVINMQTTITSTGITASNTSGLILHGNRIFGGRAKGGSAKALNLSRLKGLAVVTNNMLHGGISDTRTTTIYIEDSAPFLRNNTVFGGEAPIVFALHLFNDGSGVIAPTVENNIFWNPTAVGVVIQEEKTTPTPADPAIFRNNNVFGGKYLYFDANNTQYLTLETELSNPGLTTSANNLSSEGNLSRDISGMGFVDIDGAGNKLEVHTDNDWRLSGSADCEVREGGRNGANEFPAWSFNKDMRAKLRGTGISCTPTNPGAAGWSMGAFEF